MDNTLAYIDQASFLGFRALGRGPVPQVLWIYEHPVNLDNLRQFHRNLGHGLLGRRIERSPVPFGRDRWVADRGPDLDIATIPRARSEALDWADEQIRRPLDPERGPSWRLAVQPFTEGGAAVSLVASHSVVDGGGLHLAAANALEGVAHDLGYPPPGSRPLGRAVREDLWQAARAVPDMAKAVAATIRVARKSRDELATSAGRSAPRKRLDGDAPATVPTVVVHIPEGPWDQRAEDLGGTSNSLFAGIAAKVGQLQGRVDQDGMVKLAFPVSERTEGDTRANALSGMTVTVDPKTVTTSLREIRAELKRGLTDLAETRNDLLAPLPLTPLVPARLARMLEGMALGSGMPVGCSNVGQLHPALNRPDGTDAELLVARQSESRITTEILERMAGVMFCASVRVNGIVVFTVSAWQPGADNSRDHLVETVTGALDQFGLTGTVVA
ncbi:MAG TPA: hypothetical protein VIJ23_15965 [Mycobacterium sp.]